MTKETNEAVEKEQTSCSVLFDGSRAQGACSEDLEGRLGGQRSQLVEKHGYSCTWGSSEECSHLWLVFFVYAMGTFLDDGIVISGGKVRWVKGQVEDQTEGQVCDNTCVAKYK